MRTTFVAPLLAAVVLSSLTANAQITLNDFESYTTPTGEGSVLFRQPSFSGSTSSKLDTTASINNAAVLSAGLPGGNANSGLNAFNAKFDFKDTGVTPLWLRLTTFNVSVMPNPTLWLSAGWGLSFDIYSDTPLYVSVLIRETESNAAIGANGGGTGTIEYVGGNPGAASGKGKAVAANTWTSLTFKWGSEPVAAFTGNGTLDPGTDKKGVLEAVGLAFDDTSIAPVSLWIDNIVLVPEPSSMTLALLGGFGLLALRRRR